MDKKFATGKKKDAQKIKTIFTQQRRRGQVCVLV
jgi:hypothetical protein